MKAQLPKGGSNLHLKTSGRAPAPLGVVSSISVRELSAAWALTLTHSQGDAARQRWPGHCTIPSPSQGCKGRG